MPGRFPLHNRRLISGGVVFATQDTKTYRQLKNEEEVNLAVRGSG